VTAEGNTSIAKVSVPSRAMFSNNSDVDDILSDYADDALMYDNGTNIAWFLPVPNVVLYMAHVIISRRQYELIGGGKVAHLQYILPGPKSLREALAILNQSPPQSTKTLLRHRHCTLSFLQNH
jgi:hypothetical protein